MNWFDVLAVGTRGRMLVLLRRAENTISGLAAELGISDNAVRTHIASLQRDGMVEEAGVLRATGGKPAQLYRITKAAEELFPKAYALVLGQLIEVLEGRVGREGVVELFREVASRAAAPHRSEAADPEMRIAAAVEVLKAIGGDVVVERIDDGWLLRGHGCPLSGVVRDHPSVCTVAQALIEELTGLPADECCHRGDRPNCSFRVSAASAGAPGRNGASGGAPGRNGASAGQ